MARRRSRGRSADAIDVANSLTTDDYESELLRPVVVPEVPLSYVTTFAESPVIPDDRRLFNFDQTPSYRLEVSDGRQARSGKANRVPPVSVATVPRGVSFSDSKAVGVCVRRQQRKEVLHALRHIKGGRGGSRRKRRYSPYSQVRC